MDDFWLMVYQYNSPTIVMLCSCYENNMPKSWQYWPLEVGHTMVLGEDRDGLELEVSLVNCEDRGHFLIRSFVLTDTGTGEKRKVKQYHYLDWPDFNVPKSPKHFLEFLYAIRDSGCFLENSGPPIGKMKAYFRRLCRCYVHIVSSLFCGHWSLWNTDSSGYVLGASLLGSQTGPETCNRNSC